MLRVIVPRPNGSLPSSLPPGIRYHSVMEGVMERPQNINTCCEGQGSRLLGSLPEYIYSLAPSRQTLYVNLYAESSITFDAPVALVPLPPLVHTFINTRRSAPAPSPPLLWRHLMSNGYHPGSNCEAGTPWFAPCPVNISTIEECKASCLASTPATFNACMVRLCQFEPCAARESGSSASCCVLRPTQGIAWTPPAPPPSPHPPAPICVPGDCAMIPIPTVANGTSPFHKGSFPNISGTATVLTLAGCQTACLQDQRCLQITWSPRPRNPCVMYYSIEAGLETIHGAEGFVKCKRNATNATCAQASIVPPAPVPPAAKALSTACTTFQSIDLSNQSKPVTGLPDVQQWLVVGRRIESRDDTVPPPPVPQQRWVATKNVTATLVTSTNYPFDNSVSMVLSWPNASLATLSYSLKLRMPSWLQEPLPVMVNGATLPQRGTANSYLQVHREWASGDTISFTLPTVFRLSLYTGVDQIPPGSRPGRRFALLANALVLACVGPAVQNASSTIVIPHRADNATIENWLQPLDGKSMHFRVKGLAGVIFKPNWLVNASESWTTFPLFLTGRD